jgi:hypothetical protein
LPRATAKTISAVPSECSKSSRAAKSRPEKAI